MRQIYIARQLKNIHKACRRLDSALFPDHKIAAHRLKIISFYDEYGANAVKKAFGVSRSTVFNWKKVLSESNGKIKSLVPCSRAPQRRQQSSVSPLVWNFIEKYRRDHPRTAQVTIKPALDRYCMANNIKTVSTATIGRIIRKLKLNG